LKAGEAVQLSENIVRVVADNGSVMTGPGTNSYLIGNESLTLIDPGPASEKHIDALLEAAKPRGKIDYILLTHTHGDHSPGVVLLKEKTRAQVALYPEPSGEPFHDVPVEADIPLRHKDKLQLNDGLSIEAVHTPGHASNHLCFYLEKEKALFTGDHLMNGSTVVIASPDGNMTEYLESLELLKKYSLEYLCPGHGSVMDKPFDVVDHTIKHRLGREKKVLNALGELQEGDLEAVLKKAYDDTPEFLHKLASMSLAAHLEKLERENKASFENNLWKIN
jgi:glyoxylase-like metal-dependent hydrolase (beta-lactamase superfamily II)